MKSKIRILSERLDNWTKSFFLPKSENYINEVETIEIPIPIGLNFRYYSPQGIQWDKGIIVYRGVKYFVEASNSASATSVYIDIKSLTTRHPAYLGTYYGNESVIDGRWVLAMRCDNKVHTAKNN